MFVYIRAMDGIPDMEAHLLDVRQVLTLIRDDKLYANSMKCIFTASEIPLLGASSV